MQRYPRSTAPRPRSLPNAVTAAATTEQVLARGRALAWTNREHPRSRGETTDPPPSDSLAHAPACKLRRAATIAARTGGTASPLSPS